MTESKAINACHSVRQYFDNPIEAENIEAIQACINFCNREEREFYVEFLR